MSGLSRRSFLKRAGAFVAAVGVPLFIPAERLDFGVPTGRLIVPEPEDLFILGEEPLDLRLESFVNVPCQEWVADPVKRVLSRTVVMDLPQGGTGAFRLQQSSDGKTWHELPATQVANYPLLVSGSFNDRYVRTVITRPSTDAASSFGPIRVVRS